MDFGIPGKGGNIELELFGTPLPDKSCSLCDFTDLTGFTIVQNSCPHMPSDIPQAKTGKLPCALGGQGYEQG